MIKSTLKNYKLPERLELMVNIYRLTDLICQLRGLCIMIQGVADSVF